MDKPKKASREADELVTLLRERWGAEGVFIMGVFAKPHGEGQTEIGILSVCSGNRPFMTHLEGMLEECGKKHAEELPEEIKCDAHSQKSPELDKMPQFMRDLMKEQPGPQ